MALKWHLLSELYEYIYSHLGVGSSNGAQWHANRRFSLRQLREQGMGKSKLVAGIQDQANRLVEKLKLQADKEEPVPHALKVAILNVIWQMVAGKWYCYNLSSF